MSLTNYVIRPLLAAGLAAWVANCNQGCGPYISPADAYAMEVAGCAVKANEADLKCVRDSNTREELNACREGVEWKHYQCRSAVDRKYGLYLSNGEYPSGNTPGFGR